MKTLNKNSVIRGKPVNKYEKVSSEVFKLISCFVLARKFTYFLI
jgi:hypothetical protein